MLLIHDLLYLLYVLILNVDFHHLMKIILIDDQYCNIEDCPTKEDMDVGEGDDDEDDVDEQYLNFEEEKDINMNVDEEGNENEEADLFF